MEYFDLFVDAYVGYGRYLLGELLHPHPRNYLYWLLLISLLVYALELRFPWRTSQAPVRRDFWLDAFYMLFNFFLFSLIGYHALSEVVVQGFRQGLAALGVSQLVLLRVDHWPGWLQLLSLFVLRDFVHWNVHRLLHRVDWLWQFHKVHHSVVEMGFAAHLRYHWMETCVYRTLEYVPLALLGYGIDDFIIVHLLALLIGHLNHANFVLPMGWLRYLFNSSTMHIWHHVKELPTEHRYGANFGISLSLWDYLFGTAWVPYDGRDIELGFAGIEHFPRSFIDLSLWPWKKQLDSRDDEIQVQGT